MKVSVIAAVAKNRVIGNNGELPWRLPADLKFFKATTMGKPIIMGRMTWDSLGKPLPGRRNIVISRSRLVLPEGAEWQPSLQSALNEVKDVSEVMIIGGASIYEQALPLADRMYLTLIDENVDGDTKFPEFDEIRWKEMMREDHQPDDNNPLSYSFVTLDRI